MAALLAPFRIPFLLHSPARLQQGCLHEGQGPMGWHKGTCMRAGVWGRPGARFPSLGPWQKGNLPGLPVKRGTRGPVPCWDQTFESILTFYCTEGSGVPGTTPAAQCGVVEHPPFWEHETSSRVCPLSMGVGGLLAQGWGRGTQRPPCLTPSRTGSEGEWGGVWRGVPSGSAPLIFTS